MPECCSIHFTGWYCPKCGLPISFADHGGSTPISIGNISTKNVTINQQLVQGDLIQAGGIKSTGRGKEEVPEAYALPNPPPPFEEDDLPLPPPPEDDDLTLPPPFEEDDSPLPPPPEDDDLPLPPPPEDDDLPLPPPFEEDDSPSLLPTMDGEQPLQSSPLPSIEELFESPVEIVDNSEEILPPNDAEIITDELGVEWFEENGKWFYKNPEENWELFQN